MSRRMNGPSPNLGASVSAGAGVMRLPTLASSKTPSTLEAVSAPQAPVPFSATAERLWSVAEVSRFLGIPVATLRAWRCQGRGPASVKLGRHVRYDPDNVRDWVAGQIS